jgi:uncharacterized protein
MINKAATKTFIAALILIAAVAFAADLDQAKSSGLVGERADGYLGLVAGSVPADVAELVADVNAKRKAEYQRIAKQNGITIEEVEALAGKKTIEKTRKGDWIFVNGGWQKK